MGMRGGGRQNSVDGWMWYEEFLVQVFNAPSSLQLGGSERRSVAQGPDSAGQGPGSESLCAGPGNTADPCPCKPNQLRDLDRD
ncbi:unnamed protein product [Leuciscus chuanchicus]